MHHQSKITIFSLIAFLFTALCSSSGHSADFYMELFDYVNKDLNRIYLSSSFIKLANKREIKIIDIIKEKVLYLNPQTNTFYEKSFAELASIERINKRYNKDSTLFSSSDGNVPDIKVLSDKTVAVKNKGYPAIVLKYRTSKGKTKTILSAKSQDAKAALTSFLANPVIARILSSYFSSEEMVLIKLGYIPLRTQKLYTLRDFYNKNFSQGMFLTPAGYTKKSGGDYYRDIATKIMKDGSGG